MKVKQTIALMMALLMVVIMCLCGCSSEGKDGNAAGQTEQANTSSSADAASSQIGSGEGYSSSAGIDMSGNSTSSMTGDIPSSNSREVKFKDDKARSTWDTLYQDRYIFFWSDSNNKMTEWPGEKMQKNSAGYYTYTVPEDAAYIIFDAGTDLYQTVDIPFDGSVTEYQLTGELDDDSRKYLVETWSGGSVAEAKYYDNEQQVSNSSLGISVEKASVTNEYYTQSFATNGGNDAVVFTIKNNTTDTIRQLTLYVVFLDAQGNTVKPFGSYNMSNDINVLTTNDVIIQPGETKEIPYRCDADEFVKFDSVVASYLVGRTMYNNTDADTWAQKYMK